MKKIDLFLTLHVTYFVTSCNRRPLGVACSISQSCVTLCNPNKVVGSWETTGELSNIRDYLICNFNDLEKSIMFNAASYDRTQIQKT
jgi:hypothetical protein